MAVKQPFRIRSFISYSIFVSFLALAVSGIMMYLRPEGSIARWTNWRFLGLNKKGWEEVHTTLALLFVVLTAVHIVLNWKALVSRLRTRMAGVRRPGRELAAAVFVVIAMVAISVVQWWPASRLITWRTAIKAGENIMTTNPPALDTDKLPLNEIARLAGADINVIVSGLRGRGYDVQGPEDTLEKIARKAGASPEKIYRLILAGFPQ